MTRGTHALPRPLVMCPHRERAMAKNTRTLTEEEIAKLNADIAALVKALELFADPAAWRLGGSCDPNSGAFCGLDRGRPA